MVSYNIKWVTTSWTYSRTQEYSFGQKLFITQKIFLYFLDILYSTTNYTLNADKEYEKKEEKKYILLLFNQAPLT